MTLILSIAKWLERLLTTAAKLSVWLILALMFVIVSDVVLRHWFVIGSTKLQELEWHIHGALFLMCLGWAYTKNAHVRIELFSERLSSRNAAIVELSGCLCFLIPYVVAILFFGFDYMIFSLEYNEASASATGLANRWIIKSFILIGFGLLGISALSRTLECIVYLFGPPHLKQTTFFATSRSQENKAA